MHNILLNAKVLVFDLDGTLYDGTEHYDYYASQLEKEVDLKYQELFRNDYEQMKKNNHILSIGKVYDRKNDYVLTLDPLTLSISEIHTWDGKLVDKNQLDESYLQSISLNDPFIPIGDGWWLPLVTSYHYGAKDVWHCYDKTKEYMSTEDFKIPHIKGLIEGLNELKNTKKLVLLTNSDRADVTRLLKILKLDHLFHLELTDGNKPLQTEQHLKKIMEDFNVLPEEVVSIGDNFINEIVPALKLGMHGVYITDQSFKQISSTLSIIPKLEMLFE
jgi:putative hydrolase of the HAD superfamily